MRPMILDLYCKAGGAAMGYYRSGFDVVGVDIDPQPRYPFEFIKADAIDLLRRMLYGGFLSDAGKWYFIDDFAAIHASPPCQKFSTMTKRWKRETEHPDLIDATRQLLIKTRLPYVIENVRSSGLNAVLMLCGSMFALPLRRHRYFEMTDPILLTLSCRHDVTPVAVYGHSGGSSKRDGLVFGGIETWKSAMQIDWMTGHELAEAIPPAYTEFIGKHLLEHLSRGINAT